MSNRASSDNLSALPDTEAMMSEAVELSRRTLPHPNPRVGCLVVSPNGEVVGRGFHLRPGAAHAEPVALESAGAEARGATLVVTLEPHNHHGRTPPCTDTIIDAGIARVIIGALDPNPLVSGSGVARLEDAGIAVIVGVGESEVVAADAGYFHHLRTGRARFVAKLASTLDGQTAALDGSSQWITGESARRDVHRLRSDFDAIVIGARTLRTDDPLLSVRLAGYSGHQPRPVVLAGRQDLPDRAALYANDPVVFASNVTKVPTSIRDVIRFDGELVDPNLVVESLTERGMRNVLIEGGGQIVRAFLDTGSLDAAIFYFGGKIAGGQGRGLFSGAFETLASAVNVRIDSVITIDNDIRVDVSFVAPHLEVA